jgi:hypothetical protein
MSAGRTKEETRRVSMIDTTKIMYTQEGEMRVYAVITGKRKKTIK